MGDNLEHLKLLSIFHYVVGGLAALFACLPMFHFIFGLVFMLAPAMSDAGKAEAPA